MDSRANPRALQINTKYNARSVTSTWQADRRACASSGFDCIEMYAIDINLCTQVTKQRLTD
jgi:hypothetical protein